MSLIACTNDCVYQQDGCCRLERAASSGTGSVGDNGCVYYIKKNNKKKPLRDAGL